MKVLSLFDGISCGMVALERAGIKVDRYVAYEIDKYAIQASEKNYPQIEHKGDVFDANFKEYKGFDLLIGGSPCTYWSIARNNREVTPDGIGGQLFMQYKRALDESSCKYFLYENNYSIHQNIKEFISEQLGVQPIMINSALVSAQNRKRCYWTNIPNVSQPEDKGILLADVLENGMPWQDKSYCMTASYAKAVLHNTLKQKQRTMVAVPVGAAQCGRDTMMRVPEATKQGYCEILRGGCVDLAQLNSKTRRGRKMTDKSNCLTTDMQFYQYIGKEEESIDTTKPVRLGNIGNTTAQANRVYSVKGKSVCLQSQAGGGKGSKTGLYKIDLPDGEYIIRKLTPIEAERLQTLPDNYTAGISNTQRYKCIGNGWTVDVIAYIFKHLKDEEKE